MAKHIFSLALILFLMSACSSNLPTDGEPLPVPAAEAAAITPTPFSTLIGNSTEAVKDNIPFYVENGIIFGYDTIEDYGENGLARVKVKEKYGYINKLGNTAIDIEWEDAPYKFNENFTFAKKASKWTMIDTEGKIISDVPWDDYSILSKRFALVKKDNQYFSIDAQGVVISEFQWRDVSNIYLGELLLVKENEKYGLIDVFGNIVADIQWDEIKRCQYDADTNGFFAVKTDEKWGLLDLSGEVVITPEWDELRSYDNTMLLACRNGLWGCVNALNEIIIEPMWDSAFYFSNGINAAVSKEGKYGCIDKNGTIVIEPEWDYAYFPRFSNVLCVADNDDKTQKLIDMNGKTVLELGEKYCMVEGVIEDLVVLCDGSTQTVNLKTGENLLEEGRWWGMCSDGFFFFGGSPFLNGGLRQLQDTGNHNIYGYIDSTGRLVSEEEYDEDGRLLYEIKYDLNGKKKVTDKTMEPLSAPRWIRAYTSPSDHDFDIILKGGKYGIADKKDKIFLDPIYDSIRLSENGIYVIGKNGKYGILNLLSLN